MSEQKEAGFGELLSKAQELQSKLKEVQERLGEKEVTGQAGGGMVEVDVNGRMEVVAVRLDPGVFRDSDRNFVQDMLVSAVNDGLRRSRELATEEVAKAAGGLAAVPWPFKA